MSGITVRRIDLGFPKELPIVFIEGEPEESFAQIGFSLLLPYLEPYIVRTMKAATDQIVDQRLREQVRAFNLQEGQHYRQHQLFNELFRNRGYERFVEFEASVAEEYRRFTAEKPLSFNLAYAEGFEAFTAALSLHFLVKRDKSKWHPAALDLFSWHLIEELEHRNVVFDAYKHVCGSYTNRVRVGWFAQRHLLGFTSRVIRYMISASPEILAQHGGEEASRARLARMRRRMNREFLPAMLATHLPWYSPRRLQIPEDFERLRAHYTDKAVRSDAPVPA